MFKNVASRLQSANILETIHCIIRKVNLVSVFGDINSHSIFITLSLIF